MRWIIEGKLAGSHRPGYRDEYATQVTQSKVDDWIEEVKSLGISSIICLLHSDQLSYYSSLRSGLIDYYEINGFNVRHVPVYDYQSPSLDDYQLDKVWDSYQHLHKPVLVHCSAGCDRTGQATRHIQRKISEELSA